MGHSQEGTAEVTASAHTSLGTEGSYIRDKGNGGFHQHLRGNDLGDDPNTEIIRWKCGAAGDSVLQGW